MYQAPNNISDCSEVPSYGRDKNLRRISASEKSK